MAPYNRATAPRPAPEDDPPHDAAGPDAAGPDAAGPDAAGPVGPASLDMVDRALHEGRITAAYQPVVDATDRRRVAFHEGLIRMKTRRGALIAPAQFLPVTRNTALAATLDREMLRQGLATLAADPELRLSLNLADHAIDDPKWFVCLADAISAKPDVGYRLILEVSESPLVLNHPGLPRLLDNVRAMGITVALDDFGAGATGFHSLRRFRFDMVKIDGSYGDGLDRDRDAQALVKAMVDIARHFEMMVILEHVDSVQSADVAQRLGVDALQGYLFGRPGPL